MVALLWWAKGRRSLGPPNPCFPRENAQKRGSAWPFTACLVVFVIGGPRSVVLQTSGSDWPVSYVWSCVLLFECCAMCRSR